jgi:hypothetical protein
VNSIVQFLVQHGYSVLFRRGIRKPMGLPVPSVLFLLAAGALAGSGKLSLAGALGLAAERGGTPAHALHCQSHDEASSKWRTDYWMEEI